jgi:hypothetical protein
LARIDKKPKDFREHLQIKASKSMEAIFLEYETERKKHNHPYTRKGFAKDLTDMFNEHLQSLGLSKNIAISDTALSKWLGFWYEREADVRGPTVVGIFAFANYFEISSETLYKGLKKDSPEVVQIVKAKIERAKRESTSSPKFPIGDTEFAVALEPFLRSAFGNDSKYAYGAKDKEYQMKLLFSSSVTKEQKVDYYLTFLPLSDGSREVAQRGIVSFEYIDNTCKVSASIESSQHGASVMLEYRGFFVLLNPNDKERGAGWCFLKLTSGDKDNQPRLAAICFRLVKGDTNWQSKVCQVLTTSSDDPNPRVFRAILSKAKLHDDDMRYYAGHLRLNSGKILVPKRVFDATHAFFNGKSYDFNDNISEDFIKDMESHFLGVKKATLAKIFESLLKVAEMSDELYTISLGGLPKGKRVAANLKYDPEEDRIYGPVVMSWLRKYSFSDTRNRLVENLDRDVEDLRRWLDESRLRRNKLAKISIDHIIEIVEDSEVLCHHKETHESLLFDLDEFPLDEGT